MKVSGWSRVSGSCRRPAISSWVGPKTGRRGVSFTSATSENRRLGSIGEVMEGNALWAYATLCGRTLARAHARSGEPAVLAGYMGRSETLDDAMASFAMAYAKQTKQDHARLMAWLAGKNRKKPKAGTKH